MTDRLQTFRDNLYKIFQDKKKDILERRASEFYFNVLKAYDDRVFKRQSGFGRGIGGTGDNIISMPVVERNEVGAVLEDNGTLRTTHCMFDDFQSYLDHIEQHLPVRRCVSRWKVMPSSVNGLTMDEYQAIWMRNQGLERE